MLVKSDFNDKTWSLEKKKNIAKISHSFGTQTQVYRRKRII